MGWTGIIYWLLPRRFRTTWPLLAIAAFGILATVTLMAVGAVYSRGLAEGGVRHSLAIANAAVIDTQVIINNRPLGIADYTKLRASVEDIAQDRIGYMTREVHRFGRTQPNWLLTDDVAGQRPSLGSPVGRPFFLTGFQEHTRLVRGRWPNSEPRINGGRLEMVIGEETATRMRWGVDSQIALFPFRGDASEKVVLTVVGLAEPIDSREEYWLNAPVYFSVQEVGETLLTPIYLTEEDFFEHLGGRYPAAVGDFGWYLFFDTSVINAANADDSVDAIIGLETDINKRFPRSFVLSILDNTLIDYERELTLARVPLFLFIGLVVLVILYFLALVLGMLARYRSEEAGLLRSRGGSVLQVGALLIAGEGVITLVSVIVGPFLAWAIVRYFLLNTINPLGAEDGVTVGISADMFVMGAIGGLLSLIVLLGNGLSRARQGMAGTLQDRSRPPSVPFLHRYYIDVLVLAGLGILWWQIGSQGGFVSRGVTTGALEFDPSLLFGPVLMLLAAGFLILRFLPYLMRILAWWVSRVSPPWVAFSIVRIARDPLPHGSLVIILMMAAALGVFGASFQSTLAKSQRERTLFRQGGDLVMRGRPFSPTQITAASDTTGILAASPISRHQITFLDSIQGSSASMVGVDPNTLHQTAWFREDFSEKSLAELMRPLRINSAVGQTPEQNPFLGIPIPANAETIGIWINIEDLKTNTATQDINFWLRLRDSRGIHRNLSLGDLRTSLNPDPKLETDDASGASPPNAAQGVDRSSSENSDLRWIYLENTLPASLSRGPRAESSPMALVAFFMTRASISPVSPGSIGIDDVTVRGHDALGSSSIIEGFEARGIWAALANLGAAADKTEFGASAARTGETGLRFSWEEPLTNAPRGIFLPSGPYPLPAVGSSIFRPGQILRLRERKNVVPIVITGKTEFFPTVNPSNHFLLINWLEYSKYLKRIPQGTQQSPREVWLAPRDGFERQQVISSLAESMPQFISIRDRDELVDVAERNPLAGGGWDGLTILAITTITGAVLLALAIHSIVAVHTGRIDLTMARVMGFTKAQILLSLALERILVAVLGIGIGSAIGIGLGRWVLGFLDITLRGDPVVPPMTIILQGWLVGLVLGCLAAAILLSLILAIIGALRLKMPEVLRAGE